MANAKLLDDPLYKDMYDTGSRLLDLYDPVAEAQRKAISWGEAEAKRTKRFSQAGLSGSSDDLNSAQTAAKNFELDWAEREPTYMRQAIASVLPIQNFAKDVTGQEATITGVDPLTGQPTFERTKWNETQALLREQMDDASSARDEQLLGSVLGALLFGTGAGGTGGGGLNGVLGNLLWSGGSEGVKELRNYFTGTGATPSLYSGTTASTLADLSGSAVGSTANAASSAAGSVGSALGTGAGATAAGTAAYLSDIPQALMPAYEALVQSGMPAAEAALSVAGTEAMAALSPTALSEISTAFMPAYEALVSSGMPAAEAALSIGSSLASAGAGAAAGATGSVYAGVSAATMAELSGSAIGSLGGSGAAAAGGTLGGAAIGGLLAIPAILFAIGTTTGWGTSPVAGAERLKGAGEALDRQMTAYGRDFGTMLQSTQAGDPTARTTLDEYIYYTLNGKFPWSVSYTDQGTGPMGDWVYRKTATTGTPLADFAAAAGRMPTLAEAQAILSVIDRNTNPAQMLDPNAGLGYFGGA